MDIPFSYKAAFPENTIPAFDAAVKAGCTVIETDLHMSADGKIVITHDIETKRVFGESHNITTTNYENVLNKLLTIKEPRSKMPLFDEVLIWCIEVNEKQDSCGNETVKLMLDIKTDNDPEILYKEIFELFNQHNGIDYWKDKVIFGLWRPEFYNQRFTDFLVVNISFDFYMAKNFLKEIKNKSSKSKLHAVSMVNLILYRKDEFKEFIDWLEANNLKLWMWTINENIELKSILTCCSSWADTSLLEGVITDDPIKLLDVEGSLQQYNWKYRLSIFIKSSIYGLMLRLIRNKYDISYLVIALKKIGFL